MLVNPYRLLMVNTYQNEQQELRRVVADLKQIEMSMYTSRIPSGFT